MPQEFDSFRLNGKTDVGQPLKKKLIAEQLINGIYFFRIINGNDEQGGRLIIAK